MGFYEDYEEFTLEESEIVEEIDRYYHFVRNPLILIMGKPVTPEKAQQIIANEAPLFHCDVNDAHAFIRLKYRGVLSWLDYGWLNTWIYPSGEIFGHREVPLKRPEPKHLLSDWITFAKHTDDIDMVVCYTSNHEEKCLCCMKEIFDERHEFDGGEFLDKDCPEYQYCMEKRKQLWEAYMRRLFSNNKNVSHNYVIFWHDWSDYRERYWFLFGTSHLRADVCNDVMLCIHIHNGDYTLYFGEPAAAKAKEYYDKYYDARLDGFYNNSVFDKNEYRIFPNEYILECFKMQGKSEADYNKAVENKLFIPMTEQNEVMTSEKYLRLLQTDWKGYIDERGEGK